MIKAGTVVELLARNGVKFTIRYKDITGDIPASKFGPSKESSKAPSTAKNTEAPTKVAPSKLENRPANPPQNCYG